MANIEHKDLGGVGTFGTAVGAAVSGNHGIDVAAVATQAARFALTPLVSDVSKVVKQTDTGTYWMLTNHTLVGSAAGWRQVSFPQHAGAADVGKAIIATADDVAFGTNFGTQNLVTAGFFSLGVGPVAGAGNLRLPNASTVYGRNAANSADLKLLELDSGNQCILGNPTGNTVIDVGSIFAIRPGGANNSFTITPSTCTLGGGGVLTTLQFSNNLSAPVVKFQASAGACFPLLVQGQDSSSTAGVTAGTLQLKGGSCTGASGSRTGGNCDMQPGTGATAGGQTRLLNAAGTAVVTVNDTGLGFFAASPVAKQTITGSRGGNAALADLLTKLALAGLITDSTS